ncbi:MAG TPA: hypothetical protein VF173_18110 [Thermoanaerobaculia bacterium]|nr:hypothetical protein [Thermoanaerobaculia bacterium]
MPSLPSPLFTGHFPGRPILPGIAHLALAQGALEEITGRAAPLAAVRSLKLRRPVTPGEELELRIGSPGEDGAVRFEAWVGGAVASQGTITVRGPEWAAAETAVAQLPAAGFPPPSELLPHRPPALLLRAVSEVWPEGITAVAEVPRDHPLVAGGRFPTFLLLEAAAQAAGVLAALGRHDSGGPRIGYLVGIRDATFAVPSLAAGSPVRVTARLEGGAGALAVYAATAGEPGHEVAAGTLSTFVPGDP